MNKILNIGFDATSITRTKTGIEVYTFELLKALEKIDISFKLHLFIRKPLDPILHFLIQKPNIQIHWSPFDSQLLTEQCWLPWILFKLKLDGVHFPAFPPSLLIRKNILLSVHDDVPWEYPQTMSTKGKIYFKIPLSIAIKKAKGIITDTKYHQHKLKTRFSLKNNPAVIPLAARVFSNNHLLPLPIQNITLPYLLTVGSLEPRKNIPLLLKVYQNLILTNQIDCQLVVVGRKAWIHDKDLNKFKDLVDLNFLIFTDYVPDESLLSLYQNAELFIFPSLYEGFGLPPVEAVFYGCPVLCSNSSCLPEVLGSSVEYFENNNSEHLQQKLLQTLQRKKSNRHQEKLTYSWDQTIQKTIDFYQTIFSDKSS